MSIIKLSKQIPDPRVTGRTVHKMEHIIYITIAAVLAGCQTWDDIAEFGRTKKEFFKSRLVGLEHIPSHDTFNRFFLSLIQKDLKRSSETGLEKL